MEIPKKEKTHRLRRFIGIRGSRISRDGIRRRRFRLSGRFSIHLVRNWFGRTGFHDDDG